MTNWTTPLLQAGCLIGIGIGFLGISSSPTAGTFDTRLVIETIQDMRGIWEIRRQQLSDRADPPTPSKLETFDVNTDCVLTPKELTKQNVISQTPCKIDDQGWKYYDLNQTSNGDTVRKEIKLRTNPVTGKLIQWLPVPNQGNN